MALYDSFDLYAVPKVANSLDRKQIGGYQGLREEGMGVVLRRN